MNRSLVHVCPVRAGAGNRLLPPAADKSDTARLRQAYGVGTCPKHGTQPKNNAEFWLKKISGNQARDRLVTRTLRTKGWRVLRVWQHELTKKNERRLLSRLRGVLPPLSLNR
jgi:hypothetical protein